MAGKTCVFIVGATGYTGGAIAEALLQAGTFRLSVLIRESSINKPVIKELTEALRRYFRSEAFDFRDYIKELDLPHTFIEVGWWLSWMLPPLHSAANTFLAQKYYIDNRDQKLVYSTLSIIGKMVARIIIDPRTLGQTVVVYDEEISTNET